jgi:hypothetical protein
MPAITVMIPTPGTPPPPGVCRLLCPAVNFRYPAIKTTAKIKLENVRCKKSGRRLPEHRTKGAWNPLTFWRKPNLNRASADSALNNPVELQRLLNKAVDDGLLLLTAKRLILSSRLLRGGSRLGFWVLGHQVFRPGFIMRNHGR